MPSQRIGQLAVLGELAARVDNQALDVVAQETCCEALCTRSEK
jgi:hypothetical protein